MKHDNGLGSVGYNMHFYVCCSKCLQFLKTYWEEEYDNLTLFVEPCASCESEKRND